jgi:outer membrane lipoprotein SlyB
MHTIEKFLFYMVIILFVSALVVTTQAEESALPPGTNPANHAIFPAKDQSSEQQLKDQLAAYNWATQQTGWDPYKAYDKLVEQGYVSQQKADQAKGGAVRGAARGALVGMAIGSLSGEAGKGASAGAIAGGAVGGIRSRGAQKEAGASQQQAVDAFKRQFAEWDKNYVAAMQGKGYTVK